MKICIGKIRRGHTSVTLPKCMLSIGWMKYSADPRSFWMFGQLYRGYWGLYCFWRRVYVNFWWHHMES